MTERSSGSAQVNARKVHLALEETPVNLNGRHTVGKRKKEKRNTLPVSVMIHSEVYSELSGTFWSVPLNFARFDYLKSHKKETT